MLLHVLLVLILDCSVVLCLNAKLSLKLYITVITAIKMATRKAKL